MHWKKSAQACILPFYPSCNNLDDLNTFLGKSTLKIKGELREYLIICQSY